MSEDPAHYEPPYLPLDIARCHDARCEVRDYCERWRARELGGERTVHAATLRQAWECHDELCTAAIAVGEE